MADHPEQAESGMDKNLNLKTSDKGDAILEHADTVDKPCHFLKIAKELRLQIYGYLLIPNLIYVRTWDQPERVGLPADDAGGIRAFIWGPELCNDPVYPSILRTCQQIYDEAKQTLYSPRELLFNPCLDTHGRERGTARGQKYHDSSKNRALNDDLHHIRSIKLLTVLLGEGTGNMEKMMAHTSFFTRHLKDVNHVQMLRLTPGIRHCPRNDKKDEAKYMALLECVLRSWMEVGKEANTAIEVLDGYVYRQPVMARYNGAEAGWTVSPRYVNDKLWIPVIEIAKEASAAALTTKSNTT
ncbi:hypothetical protein LTR56_009718 [Elasticomyces elasticus]|nr:hypothetical protein LTR22_025076 [Elasticomyces elasticus]KAK3644181.1 hypothetical protein LTR56_009718 [Elasticomyces elasticus]KAK4919138.1 hypothetical protein LTR49_013142 [Elasticomyces elasticus]KAK5741805.1 hypothetical protein LTS12_024482 [Elasticomyces elasticus]